jgi:glycosyltransferase involved in cell wall biosynthesis
MDRDILIKSVKGAPAIAALKISVCIPAYNRASLLSELLDSIFTQDYQDYEVIIAEDNSPERKEIIEIANNYKVKYANKITYHENEINLGYDGNIKKLIRLARGEYVMFMGNDDLMAPGALVEVSRALEAYSNIGVVLRSYASFSTSTDKIEQEFRYFKHDAYFPPGANAIITFFRRSVFISGIVVRRNSAMEIETDRFDGTLLYQQYLVSEILKKERESKIC